MKNPNNKHSFEKYSSISDFTNLKVFLINRYHPLGSVYRWTQDLSSIFKEHSTQINLLFDKNGWNKPHEGIDFKGKFFKVPPLNHLIHSISFRDALKYIENERRQGSNIILHYTNQFSGIFKINGILEIINIQDSPYYLSESRFYERFYMRRLYESLKHKEHIITNTNTLKDELIEFGFDGDITTVYLPHSKSFNRLDLEKDTLRKKLGLPVDKKLILSVSTDSPRKNLGMVSRVMKILGDDYRLVRVGKPLWNSITFNDVEDSKLNEIYNACDVLLFPSLYEGFGLPIVEAFASGLPVVTSNIPTIQEVSDGSAILINPMKPREITEGLLEALSRQENFSKLGIERSHKFSFKYFKYSIDEVYKKITKSE
ncbi:MAG: glycosyltransferase family 4 protein [Thermoplasmataceae archaeon]